MIPLSLSTRAKMKELAAAMAPMVAKVHTGARVFHGRDISGLEREFHLSI